MSSNTVSTRVSTDQLEREVNLPGEVQLEDLEVQQPTQKKNMRVSISEMHTVHDSDNSHSISINVSDSESQDVPILRVPMQKSMSRSRSTASQGSRQKSPHEPPFTHPEGYKYLCGVMSAIDGSSYCEGDLGLAISELLATRVDQDLVQSTSIYEQEGRFTRRKTVDKALESMRSTTEITLRMLQNVTKGMSPTRSLHDWILTILGLLLLPIGFTLSILPLSLHRIRGIAAIRVAVSKSIFYSLEYGKLSLAGYLLLFAIILGGAVFSVIIWSIPSLFNISIHYILALSPATVFIFIFACLFAATMTIPTSLPASVSNFLHFYKLETMNCMLSNARTVTASAIWTEIAKSKISKLPRLIVLLFAAFFHAAIPIATLLIEGNEFNIFMIITTAISFVCAATAAEVMETYLTLSAKSESIAVRFSQIHTGMPLTSTDNLTAWVAIRKHARTVLGYSATFINGFLSLVFFIMSLLCIGILVLSFATSLTYLRKTALSTLILMCFDVIVLGIVQAIMIVQCGTINRVWHAMASKIADSEWNIYAGFHVNERQMRASQSQSVLMAKTRDIRDDEELHQGFQSAITVLSTDDVPMFRILGITSQRALLWPIVLVGGMSVLSVLIAFLML